MAAENSALPSQEYSNLSIYCVHVELWDTSAAIEERYV